MQDELHLEERAIEPIFEECVAVMEGIARERRVTVRIEPAGDKPVVILDAMRKKQVFINLILNAVQASPEGLSVVDNPGRGVTFRIVLPHGSSTTSIRRRSS